MLVHFTYFTSFLSQDGNLEMSLLLGTRLIYNQKILDVIVRCLHCLLLNAILRTYSIKSNLMKELKSKHMPNTCQLREWNPTIYRGTCI